MPSATGRRCQIVSQGIAYITANVKQTSEMNRAILHALVSASTFLSPAAGWGRLTLLTARRREDGSIPQIGNMTSVFASMITNIDAQRLHEKSNCHSCSGYSIAGRRS
jgi:hypothetical protein